MNDIIINGVVFKQVELNNNYYIDQDGNVYSKFCKKIIRHMYRTPTSKTYAYVDMYIDGVQKHMPIHKLVYLTWIGSIPKGMQINHKDDNSLNNNYLNLYAGTQKDNIKDCIGNRHRVSYITVFDKYKNKIITFCPAKNIIPYANHTCKNGFIRRWFCRKWF